MKAIYVPILKLPGRSGETIRFEALQSLREEGDVSASRVMKT